jgi:hypothetical protein
MNELDELFEQFWNAGMVKVNKKKARQIFTKLAKKEEDVFSFTENLIIDIQKRLEIRQLGFSAMHPTTYLNGERWDDEYRGVLNETSQRSNQTHSQRQHQQAADAYKQMELEHTESNPGIIRPLR